MTDFELIQHAKRLNIPHFRGVYMRDTLPINPHIFERGIVNLDENDNSGTHWTAYVKEFNSVYWFDPFGNIPPPTQVVDYFTDCKIFYNDTQFQNFGTTNCGKLCLEFLNGYKTV